MPVIIGELDVVAAPPPVGNGRKDTPQREPLTVLDIVRVTEREQARRVRREAD